jgi:D-alanyl-D-alanine carboxypeptidase
MSTDDMRRLVCLVPLLAACSSTNNAAVDAGEPDAAVDAGEPDAAVDAGEPDAAVDAGEPDAGGAPVDAADGAPTRSAACVAQDTSLQLALDVARQGFWGSKHPFSGAPSRNAMLAVRNADCGTTVYVSGDPSKATQASLWRIASVTKTFVSASILSVVKEGKVSLNDPLSKWVPNVPGTAGVTVLMLLDHRSGIFNYTEDPTFDFSKPWTPQQIVALATAHSPYFAPDGGFYYSNTDYILLGMILEAATGQKAGAVLHARAIDVAKLPATFLDGYDKVDASRMARGFYDNNDVTFEADPSAWWTAAAMVASGGDVADWVATLYDSDTILDANQRALLSLKTSPLDDCITYGLGVMFSTASCWLPNYDAGISGGGHSGASIGHQGQTFGFTTEAWYFPDKKTAIVSVVNNTDDQGCNSVACDGWIDVDSVERAAIQALFP